MSIRKEITCLQELLLRHISKLEGSWCFILWFWCSTQSMSICLTVSSVLQLQHFLISSFFIKYIWLWFAWPILSLLIITWSFLLNRCAGLFSKMRFRIECNFCFLMFCHWIFQLLMSAFSKTVFDSSFEIGYSIDIILTCSRAAFFANISTFSLASIPTYHGTQQRTISKLLFVDMILLYFSTILWII